MPALDLSSKKSSSLLMSDMDEWGAAESPGHGSEAEELNQFVKQMLNHFRDRAETLVAAFDEGDDFAYNSVPPNRTFYVNTRYVYKGKGTPLPFDLDDE